MNTSFGVVPTGNIKKINRFAILDLIRFTPAGISRVELARKVGLTRAAVTTIISDLLAEGLILEAESRNTHSGRRPVVLQINPEVGLVAAVDVGATHATALVADFSARVLAEKEISLDIDCGPEKCLSQVDALLRETLDQAGLSLSRILAVGVGVPGPVSPHTGSVVSPPLMPGWEKFPIREQLNKWWGVPVLLNNDAELGAIGEWAYGAGRGEPFLMYVKSGSGVGAGILLNGQVYQGACGTAGEIGHITIDENGPLCKCGNHGCLEAFSGGNAIVAQARRAVESGQVTQLAFVNPREKITIKDVIESARNGDLISQQIMSDAGAHLGTAIAGLVNMFNPGMIVIGGGVSQVGDLLLEPIRHIVSVRSLKASSHSVRITSALLGRRSSAMGGIVQAMTEALHQPQSRKEVHSHRAQSIRTTQSVPVLLRETGD